jgi:hypothetical protein
MVNIALSLTYYLKGWILNRIPEQLVEAREVVSFNRVFGSLSHKNIPII